MKQYASIDDTVYFWFASNDTSGSGDDGAAPAADVRLAGAAAAAAPMYSPVPVLLSDAGYPPGAYEVAITASVANGFAADNTYAVFCTLAVDAQNPTGFVGSFDTMPVQANAIEISGDATAADNAELAFDGTGFGFTNCVMPTVTTLTGHTAQSGDSFGRIGATGSGLTTLAQAAVCTEVRLAELAAANLPSDVDDLLTRLSAVRAGYLDNLNGHTPQTGDSFAIVNHGTYGNAALETLVDDVETILTHGTYGNSALQVLLADRPTVAQLNARTLLAANYFDFTTDSVVVGTNNDKTGYALSNVGADLILKTATFALAIADAIWDEVLTGATHNIATSAGRRLRELGANFITSGTAQAGAAYSITLDAGDAAADHIYNRNLLVIMEGTGAGQTRTIVDFANATKIAVVDRDWWIQPDATSVYTIIPDDTPIVADHGIATAGTNNTITIRASASAINSTYQDLIIYIMAGTGAGQARLIDTYVGATKVVTIHGTWTTNPDATSVYAMIASGMSHVQDIGADALALIKSEADDALSDVHLDDLIQLALTVNDGAPNAADFITDSIIAIDNWYNQNMLLFTSGALAGLARYIDDYDGGTKRIYLTEAFPQAPANTDDFVIVGISGSAPTGAAIADAVWDELEAGHVLAGSFGEEVTKQGKKLDRNLILDL